MAYKSKYKGKDVDNLLDKINKLEIPSLNGYATEQYVQQQLGEYATEQYVQQQLGNIDTILDSIIKG